MSDVYREMMEEGRPATWYGATGKDSTTRSTTSSSDGSMGKGDPDDAFGASSSRSSKNSHKINTSTTTARTRYRSFCDMALPYFREESSARWLFFLMIVLTLLNSAVRVFFSYLARDFWSALSEKDVEQFYQIMQRFLIAMMVLAPINVFYRYQKQILAIRWRDWMTQRVLQLYFQNRVYYGLERNAETAGPTTSIATNVANNNINVVDNPDQRISQDVRSFTEFSLTLFLEVLMAVVDFLCFSVILFTIMPQLFLAILVFATVGTGLTMWIGHALIQLNWDKLQREAHFRYSLVRVRDYAEHIAFLQGESVEHSTVLQRFAFVIDNMHALNRALRNLEFVTTYYYYITWILPILVVAPAYFDGAVELGVIQQAASAFAHVLEDMSLLVTQWESLTEFSAGMDRLDTFLRVARTLDPDRNSSTIPLLGRTTTTKHVIQEEVGDMSKTTTSQPLSPASLFQELPEETPTPTIRLRYLPDKAEDALRLENITLMTPNDNHQHRRLLVRNLSLVLPQNTTDNNNSNNLLIVGASGTGKSSLLRAIAGLWNCGSGSIHRLGQSVVYFLPQKPYCAVGSLRDQLLYPRTSAATNYELQQRELERTSTKATTTTSTNNEHEHYSSLHHAPNLSDSDLLQILQRLGLDNLPLQAGDGDPIRGLDTVLDWSNILSLGEQQRLAFGRILVNRPRFVILDESTSALDLESERRMYGLLHEMDTTMTNTNPIVGSNNEGTRHVTYVSVGHRPSLLAYHTTKLTLHGDQSCSIEPIVHQAADHF